MICEPIIESKCQLIEENDLSVAYHIDKLEIFLTDPIYSKILSQNYPIKYSMLISLLKKRLQIPLPEIESKISFAIKQGLLVKNKEEAEIQKGSKNRADLKQKMRKAAVTNLYLATVQDCNLICTYCSAGHGRFGQSIKYMDKETAKRSLDILFPGIQRIQDVVVVFVGGEPLLNFDIVRFILDYGKILARKFDKKIHFFMNTNGTLLSEKIAQVLVDNDVDVTVSIDGTKTIHDTYRRFKDGRGSYDLAIQGLNNYIHTVRKNDPYYSVTVQVCLPFGKGLFEAYQNLKKTGASRLVINPAWPSAFIHHGLELPLCNIDEYLQEYNMIIKDYLKQVNGIHDSPNCCMSATIHSLSQLKERKPRPLGCGAGYGSFSISAVGDVYPCSLFLENTDFKIGNVYSTILEDKRREVQNRIHSFAQKCQNCWAKNLCGAGCLPMAIAQKAEYELEPSRYCDLFRGYIERDILLFAKIRLKELRKMGLPISNI